MTSAETPPPPRTLTDHERQDARMEYEQLLINVRTFEQMWWVDVGAFLAANTLLATALGASFSQMSASLNTQALTAIRVILPVIGILFACAAGYTAVWLRRMQRLTIQRGKVVEEVLLARVFSTFPSKSAAMPWITIAASLLFVALWCAAAVAAFPH